MFIFYLQLLLTLGGTALFVIYGTYPTGILGILISAGIMLGIFLVLTLLIALVIIVSILFGAYTNKQSMFKHRLFNQYGVYLFNVLLRVNLKVSGLENLPKHGRFIAVCNHIEYTDPIYVKQVFKDFPMAFVFKEELMKSRILKALTLGTGCIPLARGMNRQGLQAILDTIEAVKNEQPMAVFPEGTRSHKNEMIPFKPGSFKIALKANADIVPVCLYDMNGTVKKSRIGIHKSYVHVLPIVPYEQFKDFDTQTVSDMIQERIEARLEQYRTELG
ncbi:MAG: 1-acyl-sn-glycerol-3-phosphate acyltransferase [Bacilli bacterium]|nr:1-acyl-sn-glycerol-3-phosphate acyltransferase [Bacilli bacterium]